MFLNADGRLTETGLISLLLMLLLATVRPNTNATIC